MPTIRAFARAHAALLVAGFAYAYVFPYLPELRSPNELCRLHQTRALADHGTVEINRVIAEWGYVGDLSRVGDRLYPSKAPLLSYAAVPVYAGLKLVRGGPRRVPELALIFFARLFCTVLPAFLVLIPMRRFLRAQLSANVADGLVVVYALGTLAYSYAELFMSHQLAAVLAFAAFYALWRLRRGEWREWGYPLAGLFAGLAVVAEYTVALALVPLGVYGAVTAQRKLRAAALGLTGVVPPALFLAWYHARVFGHPLSTGYQHLNDPGYAGWHISGFLGVTVPDLGALGASLFSPLRGLLTLSPVLLVALPGLYLAWRRRDARPEAALGAAVLVLYTYFTASFSYASWGWTTGPRHLTPVAPFLLLPLGCAVTWARERWPAGAAAIVLGAVSIANTGIATMVNYIPDSVSNAVHHLALPLFRRGDLPNNLLAIAGAPNPTAAVPALGALAVAIALLAWWWRPALRPGPGLAVGAGLAVAIFLAQGLVPSPKPSAADQDAVRFLHARWIPRPGASSPPLFGLE